jgi:hypothetical protein
VTPYVVTEACYLFGKYVGPDAEQRLLVAGRDDQHAVGAVLGQRDPPVGLRPVRQVGHAGPRSAESRCRWDHLGTPARSHRHVGCPWSGRAGARPLVTPVGAADRVDGTHRRYVLWHVAGDLVHGPGECGASVDVVEVDG